MNTQLEAIKRAREIQLSTGMQAHGLGGKLRRAVKRFRELNSVHPTHKVILYFWQRLCSILNNRWQAKIGARWDGERATKPGFIKEMDMKEKTLTELLESLLKAMHNVQESLDKDSLSQRYAVRITGGLGDVAMIARFMRDLQAYLGDGLSFDVYFQSPAMIEEFFLPIPGFRTCVDANLFERFVEKYAFSLLVNQFVTFANEHVKLNILLEKFPKVLNLYSAIEKSRKPIEKYITSHPLLDGAFADMAIRSGKKRYRYLHEMAGIPYGGDRFDIAVPPGMREKYGLAGIDYITVHDGWDNNFKLITQRPNKALPFSTWVDIVAGLKKNHPQLKIVQIGGKTGEDIPGVDLNLRAKLSFAESMSILQGAQLHIDNESGLVHVGASLGVKSVVMFGPTNMAWFSYPQNINLAPKNCSNCWWSTDTWMDICPAGYKEAKCMQEHVAGLVVSEIEKAISINQAALKLY